MIHKVVEAITTREEEAEVEVMVEEEEDEEGLMVLMVITKEEKLQTRPRRTTLRLNARDATRWGTLFHIVLHDPSLSLRLGTQFSHLCDGSPIHYFLLTPRVVVWFYLSNWCKHFVKVYALLLHVAFCG